jgi:protoheme IX farnesyltransferase
VNPLTGLLGMVTLASYVFIYTPLKKITSLNTIVGAVPGALPPLMGWTAATGELGAGGWALFTLLFFWQMPHFMAIAWMYREDYARGGFRMLPVVDPSGARTGSTAIRHTVALLAFSLSPVALGLAGRWYAGAALLLGVAFLFFAIRFSLRLHRESARSLFLASIVYLPLVLGFLVADKVTIRPRLAGGLAEVGVLSAIHSVESSIPNQP